MTKDITKDDVDYLKRVLKNYFYQKKKEQEALRECAQYDSLIEDERKARGISFDEKTGTYNNTDTPYINQLIHEKVGYEKEAEKWGALCRAVEKNDKLKIRLASVSYIQRELIHQVFEFSKGYDVLASLYSKKDGTPISKQAISDRVDNAVRAMLEVD